MLGHAPISGVPLSADLQNLVSVTPPTPPVPPIVKQGRFISTHELLEPQVILNQRQKVDIGSQWSKDEAERWINRLRKSPEEQRVAQQIIFRSQAEMEEAEAVVFLTLLLTL